MRAARWAATVPAGVIRSLPTHYGRRYVMSRRMRSLPRFALPLLTTALALSQATPIRAQATTPKAAPSPAASPPPPIPATNSAGQKNDLAYTAKIREYLQDPRITTEL